MKWFSVGLFLIAWCSCANAYFITVDAHAEECFFEKVEYGTKMGLIFEIAEGGFLDIDMTIVGPDGKVVHHVEQETSGKFSFSAQLPGIYTYCFSNQRSTLTPKVVMFNMEVGEPPKAPGLEAHADGADGNHVKLDKMISDLSNSLWGVKNEQEYMEVRDRNHRAINESTNFRVVVWSFFEASVLVCMSLGQVYYLKRFFEVRRVV